MDSFYCLVRIILNKKIALYYFNNTYLITSNQKIKQVSSPICFTAKSSKSIIKLLSLHSCFEIFSLDHAFYLGIELYKAELALILQQVYIQN